VRSVRAAIQGQDCEKRRRVARTFYKKRKFDIRIGMANIVWVKSGQQSVRPKSLMISV